MSNNKLETVGEGDQEGSLFNSYYTDHWRTL